MENYIEGPGFAAHTVSGLMGCVDQRVHLGKNPLGQGYENIMV